MTKKDYYNALVKALKKESITEYPSEDFVEKVVEAMHLADFSKVWNDPEYNNSNYCDWYQAIHNVYRGTHNEYGVFIPMKDNIFGFPVILPWRMLSDEARDRAMRTQKDEAFSKMYYADGQEFPGLQCVTLNGCTIVS